MGCTIDLRRAYKQLAIAPESLNDAYLCVFDKEAGTPAAFRTLVLLFGARRLLMVLWVFPRPVLDKGGSSAVTLECLL